MQELVTYLTFMLAWTAAIVCIVFLVSAGIGLYLLGSWIERSYRALAHKRPQSIVARVT